MGHGRIGSNINRGTPQERCEPGPIQAPALADDRRVGPTPETVDIGPLGRVTSFGRDHRKPALGEPASQAAPAEVVPAFVAIERVGMHHGVGPRRGDLGGR